MYPQYTNSKFYNRLYHKREMIELKAQPDQSVQMDDSCKFKRFEPRNYQLWVRRFLSDSTPYNSLLLIHEVGTGKTCTALLLAESLKRYHIMQDKRILYITRASLKDSIYDSIYNPAKRVTQRKRKIDQYQCLGDTYGISMEGRLKSTEEKRRISRRKINRVFKILSYGEIPGEISHKLKVKGLQWDGQIQSLTDPIRNVIAEEYSYRLIILDEVHNIKTKQSADDKLIPPYMEAICSCAVGLKLLLMSATPMYDSPRELIYYINLMRLIDKLPKVSESNYFTTDGQLKPSAEEQLIDICKGRISYVRGRKPPMFPFATYSSKSAIHNEMSRTIQDEPILTEDQIQFTKTVACQMSVDHYQHYITEVQRLGKKQQVETEEDRLSQHLEDDAIEERGTGGISSLLQINNFCKLSTNNRPYVGETGFLGELGRNDGSALFYPHRIGDTKRILIRFQDHMLHQRGTANEVPLFDPDFLQMYSPKLMELWEQLQHSTGVIYVYTEYKYFGALLIALFLEYMGLERYTVKGEYSLLDYHRNERGGGGKKNRVDYEQLTPITGTFRDKYKREPRIAKYMLLSGAIRNYDMIHLTPGRAAEIINSADNVDGQSVRIIIGTRVSGEGLDLHRIRQIHIMEPWYNLSRLEQIEGRGVRQCSHKDLRPENRNVEIFRYCTIPPKESNESIETIDYRIYRIAEKKDRAIKSVEYLLKKWAVDCYLWKDLNQFQTNNQRKYPQRLSSGERRIFYLRDEPYSRMCNYRDNCNPPCGEEIQPKDRNITNDTYPESERIAEVRRQLQFYTQLEFRFTKSMAKKYLATLIGNVYDHHLQLALDSIVADRLPVYDAYDREGLLDKTQKGEMIIYYFLPKELESQHGRFLPEYYTNQPLMLQPDRVSLNKIEDKEIDVRSLRNRSVHISFTADQLLSMIQDMERFGDNMISTYKLRITPRELKMLCYSMTLDYILPTQFMDIVKDKLYRKLDDKIWKKYIENRPFFYQASPAHWIMRQKREVWGFTKNKFELLPAVEQGRLYQEYKRSSTRRMTSIQDEFAGIHGFIAVVGKQIVYKLYVGKNRGETLTLQAKKSKRTDVKGRVCSTFKTEEMTEYLRDITGKSVEASSKYSMCKEIEFILRYNDLMRKNRVRWNYIEGEIIR